MRFKSFKSIYDAWLAGWRWGTKRRREATRAEAQGAVRDASGRPYDDYFMWQAFQDGSLKGSRRWPSDHEAKRYIKMQRAYYAKKRRRDTKRRRGWR